MNFTRSTDGSNPATPPILVVDDDESVLGSIERSLRVAEYDIVTTTDPLLALEHVRQREFSVIITDQNMPCLTGLELVAQARRIQPFATRILITGLLSLDIVIDSINKGEIYRFVVKPWLLEEFLTTVKNAVQRYDLIQQNASLQTTTHSMNVQLVELNRSLKEQVKLVAEQNVQLENLNQEQERNLLRSVELCVHTMQTFYPSLGRQARSVAELCQAMATVIDLSPMASRVLHCAALLHDIGLVGVPRKLIRKWQQDTVLDEAERALIEQHPILGQELAAFGSQLEGVGRVIRAHHERFDGGGYPDRLAGEDIPWLARLLAVAVAHCGTGLTGEESLDRIKLHAGTEFDPEAVRACLRAISVAPLQRKEREVTLAELRPGMVLSRGIFTANGLLLVPEGKQLNVTFIDKLLNHNRVQPISQSLTVYC